MRIDEVTTAAQLAEARALVKEYIASLEIALDFQDVDTELATFPGEYAPPTGAILLAHDGGTPVGVVALRRLGPKVCEMKRMYVRPEFRHRGLGRELSRRLIVRAIQLGYETMRLDTLASMGAAISLYQSLGFREVDPYRFNPVAGARFMELELRRGDH